ncbi:hypothetical protein ES705_16121 [subsurface metagenome]
MLRLCIKKNGQMKQSIPDQGIHEMVLKLKDGCFLGYAVSVPSLSRQQT